MIGGRVRTFSELSEKEILALAISLEEEHGRIYADYADGLQENFPASAKVFTEMAHEEHEHRRWLIDLYREKFGDHIPLIRAQDVKGFVRHEPLWMVRPLGLDKVRKQAEAIEYETRIFYERAMERTTDASMRKLLGDLRPPSASTSASPSSSARPTSRPTRPRRRPRPSGACSSCRSSSPASPA